MGTNNDPAVPLDDLVPGEWYRFSLKSALVLGRFGGFIRRVGRPLVLMVPTPGEVVSFPATELVGITRLRG